MVFPSPNVPPFVGFRSRFGKVKTLKEELEKKETELDAARRVLWMALDHSHTKENGPQIAVETMLKGS